VYVKLVRLKIIIPAFKLENSRNKKFIIVGKRFGTY
jgi:hypothetical protein